MRVFRFISRSISMSKFAYIFQPGSVGQFSGDSSVLLALSLFFGLCWFGL